MNDRLAVAAGMFLWLTMAAGAWAQPAPEWRVWVKTSPCSTTRQDWVTVANQDPTPNGPNFYFKFPNSNTWPTMAAAMAQADVLRVAPCTFGTGGGNGCPKFESYCCHDYSVWQNLATKAFSVRIGNFGNPGENLVIVKPMLCCETAFALAGFPATCGVPSRTGYVGCYKDTNHPFDLNGYLVQSSSNTPEQCVQTCRQKGFAYAGVQNGQSCLCGNSYGGSGPATNCSIKCTGNSGETCGGWYSNSVYSTGVAPPKPGRGPVVGQAVPIPGIGKTGTIPGGNKSGSVDPPPPPPPIGGSGGASQNWAGTWIDGIIVTNISGGGNSISASFTYKDTNLIGSGSWSNCTVQGNTAKCNWTASHEDDTKSGTRRGTLDATISGNTITGSYYEDTPQWSYKPGYSASNITSSMYKGAVHAINLTRRK